MIGVVALLVAAPGSARGEMTAACADCIDPALMAGAPGSSIPSDDVERATAQLAGVPNPIGRFLLRRSHMAYFPTELQANYAATLEALAR